MGKRVCAVCVMDKDGGILYGGKYPNTRATVRRSPEASNARTLASYLGCDSTTTS